MKSPETRMTFSWSSNIQISDMFHSVRFNEKFCLYQVFRLIGMCVIQKNSFAHPVELLCNQRKRG
jgi:hypothetical protein